MPDIARFTLHMESVEGSPAVEPDCDLLFQRTDSTTVVQGRNLEFPPDHTFDLPAFPQEKNLFCVIKPSLYQVMQSRFFIPNGDISETVTAVRLPDKWTPTFQAYGNLPTPRFDPFKKVAAASSAVDVKHGPPLGKLDDVFDSLNQKGPQVILAKMALLNLFAVLTDEKDPVSQTNWFQFVQKIVRIDRERFVAETEIQLLDDVNKIFANLDAFDGFFTELSPSMHLDNIPAQYKLTADLITIKKRYDQGNVQFTMAPATTPDGNNVVLLDCDMDEHSNLIEHTGDLFVHLFTGGTHPVEIHEYIVHDDRGVQLGYTLSPTNSMAPPFSIAGTSVRQTPAITPKA